MPSESETLITSAHWVLTDPEKANCRLVELLRRYERRLDMLNKLIPFCCDDPALAFDVALALQAASTKVPYKPPSQPLPAATEAGGAEPPPEAEEGEQCHKDADKYT